MKLFFDVGLVFCTQVFLGTFKFYYQQNMQRDFSIGVCFSLNLFSEIKVILEGQTPENK